MSNNNDYNDTEGHKVVSAANSVPDERGDSGQIVYKASHLIQKI